MKKYFRFYIIYFLFVLCFIALQFKVSAQNKQTVYVDKNGIMRWGGSKEEVHGFGVNYTVPFAHAYRMAERLGIDHKQAIDHDVYHFSRLGFDLYRVHVWDTEISDTLGNLLENEHLDLYDYLLKKLKDRGINYVITPIAYWGNGYPEPEEDTPGFSRKFGKGNCLTNPEAIKAQETYLYQFLNHVNPYTGIAYKDEPNVIAFEISNEPHHGGEAQAVTDFINQMVKSMRKTGCKKPIFYNVSHSIQFEQAYFDADIQGGTFQWYPTGLVAQRELKSNFLPNVDSYNIPFDDIIKEHKAAKLVYEFDAADIGRSYIYPAMARSYRKAGIQIATHFSYDPTYMADVNTEYFTHFMNLVYAPQKGLSLMIASEVFHNVPLYKDYGSYPSNVKFDNFHVNYEQDLAEYLTEDKFLYTNSTTSIPPENHKLQTIAGFGTSSVVQYDGLGAYFMDKINSGLWRLEVMPDAVWVKDVFGRNVPDEKVAVIKWYEWPMTVNLMDLGKDFTIKAINNGNTYSASANGNSFMIQPGTYLLEREGMNSTIKGNEKWKNMSLNEFFAPRSTVSKTYVIHEPVYEVTAGKSLSINAKVISEKEPDEVMIAYFAGWRPTSLKMERKTGYTYNVVVPGEHIREGFLRYYITINTQGTFETFPSGRQGKPGSWEFNDPDMYEVKVIVAGKPIYIFDAYFDSDQLMRKWLQGSRMVPSAEPGKGEYLVNVDHLLEMDAINPTGDKIYDYSMKFYFSDKVEGRLDDLVKKNQLVFRGRALNDKPCPLQLTFTMKDGAAFGGIIELQPKKGDYSISIHELGQVKMVTLPRPYPSFLPYYFENTNPQPFDIRNAESLQISIGPGIPENQLTEKHGIAIESVRLE